MKKNALSRPHSIIEALEGRIAPAVLVAGGNLLGGAGNPTSGEFSIGENSFAYVKVLSGQAVVWFDGIIRGISVGPNASLEIAGDVFGDIVANLDANGRLTDSDSDPTNGLDGKVLLPNAIKGIKIKGGGSGKHGSVENIVTGGSISGVNIAGDIQGIYAGDGVFHAESDLGKSGSFTFSIGIDTNPIEPGEQTSFTLSKADAQMAAGAGVASSSIGQGLELQIIAGSGNPTNAIFTDSAGPAGGSVDGITIFKAAVLSSTSSNPSYMILAGDGASGKSGGAGGSITKLSEKSSSGTINIQAGNGGNGAAGAGGAGGSIRFADISSLSGAYTLRSGDGGSGAPGGAGGAVSVANFANVSPNSSLIAASDFDGDGTDELVMMDAASGDFVVAHSSDNGATFNLVVQALDPVSLDPIYIVKGAGLATDLDIVQNTNVMITYVNSGAMTIYQGDKDGDFLSATGDSKTEEYSYSTDGYVAKYAELVGSNLFVAAINKGKSQIVKLPIGKNAQPSSVVVSVASEASSITASPAGDTYVGFVSGQIFGMSSGGILSAAPVAVGGAVASMSIGDDGTKLATLSKDRVLSVFSLTIGGNMTLDSTVSLAATDGTLQQVRFVPDGDPLVPDNLIVSHLTTTATFDVYQRTATTSPYALGTSLPSESPFKQFTVAKVVGGYALAGLTGSANLFGYSKNLAAFEPYVLPFNGKQVSVFSGRGGDGINVLNVLGKGGAGGSISGVNIDAVTIQLTAGAGGNSEDGPAGAGGGVSNPATITTSSGTGITPGLLALESLEIVAGSGGSALGVGGLKAAGGAGGGISALKLELQSGDIHLSAGNGGDGKGGSGGAGGGFASIRATGKAAGIFATAGTGGSTAGTGAKAGAGGGFSTFNFTLANEPSTEIDERYFPVTLTAGIGGESPAGIGGNGGGFSAVVLKLDGADRTYDGIDADENPLVDANLDSTVEVLLNAGNGGGGATGGKGGDVVGLKVSTAHDQVEPLSKGYFTHYIAAHVVAGNGGSGSTGDGGAGGSVNGSVFTGVTDYDKDSHEFGDTPLFVQAGTGGAGGNKGGAGGNVLSIVAQNAPTATGAFLSHTHLAAAEIYAGAGGDGGLSDGGAGGSVASATVGSNALLFTVAGNGGIGGLTSGTTAKGGAGGSVSKSTFALIDTPLGYAGLIATAGNGGGGRAAGGAGGALATITVNLPYAPLGLGAVLTAGDGGSASGTGALGGKGGDVTGITNSKDIHSAISLIEAGDGGNAAAGKGGFGGNVSSIRVAGFIGRVLNDMTPLGAFDALGTAGAFGTVVNTNLVAGKGIAQGIFVGRAGTGTTAGLAGSVSKVQAEAISAIGASVDAMGVFALAEKVTEVKASFIGYDVDHDGAFDAGTDGFILAKALSLVTGSKPAFVFNS